jgi:YVTN family beta-propeller protein
VAVTPNGSQIYVANGSSSLVWAINASSLAIEAKIPVGLIPTAVAISSNGATAYVTNAYGSSITEVNTSNNTVNDTIPEVGAYPFSVAL